MGFRKFCEPNKVQVVGPIFEQVEIPHLRPVTSFGSDIRIKQLGQRQNLGDISNAGSRMTSYASGPRS